MKLLLELLEGERERERGGVRGIGNGLICTQRGKRFDYIDHRKARGCRQYLDDRQNGLL